MTHENSTVGVFQSHTQADAAVIELKKNGLDITKLSVVGRDQHSEDQVVGYYNAGDRMKYWGKQGAFWGGIWGLLVGAGFFWVPGIGPLLVAGPLVSLLVGAVEGAVVVGGLSMIGAGLVSMGIPNDSVLQYESAIKTGKFILIFRGTAEEVERCRKVLTQANALETNVYADKATVEV